MAPFSVPSTSYTASARMCMCYACILQICLHKRHSMHTRFVGIHMSYVSGWHSRLTCVCIRMCMCVCTHTHTHAHTSHTHIHRKHIHPPTNTHQQFIRTKKTIYLHSMYMNTCMHVDTDADVLYNGLYSITCTCCVRSCAKCMWACLHPCVPIYVDTHVHIFFVRIVMYMSL